MHSLRSPTLNIAKKRLGAVGARVVAITAREQYGRGSILRTCNLSCLSVSLYPVFDISALFCPLWAAPCCLGCQLPWWFYCSWPAFTRTTATLWSKMAVCRHILPPRNFPLPPPSLSLSLSLVDSDRQAFLSEKQRGEFPIANLLSFWNESSLPPFSCVCK